jgi:hypothetical protein
MYPMLTTAFLNTDVLELIKKYPSGGGYDWPKQGPFDGVTKDLIYKDTTIAKHFIERNGTYCSGITFEIWFSALKLAFEAKGKEFDLKDIDAKELKKLKADWYVATGKRGGPVDALVSRNLGVQISSIEDARQGDFIQLWRYSGSGHSVVFKGATENGFRYWSTQTATAGIGEREEKFDKVIISELYIVRAYAPLG